MTAGDAGLVRNQRWEAGWLHSQGVSWTRALASVSSATADMFGLPLGTGRIVNGTRANFALYNGDPLTLQSYIQFIAHGTDAECKPLQP